MRPEEQAEGAPLWGAEWGRAEMLLTGSDLRDVDTHGREERREVPTRKKYVQKEAWNPARAWGFWRRDHWM